MRIICFSRFDKSVYAGEMMIVSEYCVDGKYHFTTQPHLDAEDSFEDFRPCDGSCKDLPVKLPKHIFQALIKKIKTGI